MAWGSDNSNLVYVQPIDAVYQAVLMAANDVKYKVAVADNVYHTVTLQVPISFFTWGEKVTVNMYTIADGRTSVIINSKSNLGTEIAAASKNKKNIEKLVQAMQKYL